MITVTAELTEYHNILHRDVLLLSANVSSTWSGNSPATIFLADFSASFELEAEFLKYTLIKLRPFWAM